MKPSLMPRNPRCEFLTNPLGIDTRRPRLSWIVESDENNQRQSAYRITAATSEAALAAGKPDLWDSGVVRSAETLHVAWGGGQLDSRQRCCWQRRVVREAAAPLGTGCPPAL